MLAEHKVTREGAKAASASLIRRQALGKRFFPGQQLSLIQLSWKRPNWLGVHDQSEQTGVRRGKRGEEEEQGKKF